MHSANDHKHTQPPAQSIRERQTPDVPNRALRCPRCEFARLRTAHCKLICDACGYVESCEDPFIVQAD